MSDADKQGMADPFTHIFLEKVGKAQFHFNELQPPGEINWWPQTLGWQLLALAVLGWLGFRMFRRMQWYWHNRYRYEALLELRSLDSMEPHQKLAEFSRLLKRVALVSFGRQRVAGLHGDAWLAFLDSTADTQLARFGDLWQQSLYCPGTAGITVGEVDELVYQVERWIRNHRQEPDNRKGR